MRRSMIARHALRLIGVFVFIYILLGIDVQMMLEASFNLSPLITLLLIGLVAPIMILKGARWEAISQGLGLRISAIRATEALCISQMMNLALPGSIGDLVRVPYMTNRGNPTDKSIVSLIIDAILGSIVPWSAGVLAILYVFDFDVTLEGLLIVTIWIVGVYLMYRFLKATVWNWVVKARTRKLMTEGITGKFLFSIPSLLRSIGGRNITISLLFALGSWGVFTVQAYILACAYGIDVTWYYLAISLGLSTMLTAIPISVQGLGIREGVLLFMLGRIGADPTIIVSFSLTLMLVNLTPSVVGILSWANDPIIQISEEDILNINEPELIEGYSLEKENYQSRYLEQIINEMNDFEDSS